MVPEGMWSLDEWSLVIIRKQLNLAHKELYDGRYIVVSSGRCYNGPEMPKVRRRFGKHHYRPQELVL